MADTPGPTTETRKRKRLTHACTQCRTRKIKCDEARPNCTNCEKSGTRCITVDPRGVVVQRREAQRPEHESEPVTNPSPTPNRELLPALPRHGSGYGNSLSMLSQWLDLAFFRLNIPRTPDSEQMKSQFSRRRRKAGLANVLTGMTSAGILAHAQTFMEKLNTVFPIFTKTSIDRLVSDCEQTTSLQTDETTSMLMMLVVAANVQTSQPLMARECLDFALCNVHVILDDQTVRSIQALLLLSLLNRSVDDILLASNMITLASSISQALGLHRRPSQPKNAQVEAHILSEFVSVWWCVYSLEKIISMELGRVSLIRDFECNQVLPTGANELFMALIGLAKLQSEINERLALSRHMEESSSDVEANVRLKIETVGELDQKLLEWTRSLPSYAQSLSNTIDDPEAKFAMPFLAIQYWQTLFILHRNALLLNSTIIAVSADKYCTDKPYRLRIKNGHNLCCNAARMIASILNDVYEHDVTGVAESSYAPLTAVYALSIHILKNPQLGLARADSEIQARAAEIVVKHQILIGSYDDHESQALRQLLENLRTEVATRLKIHSPNTVGLSNDLTPRASLHSTLDRSDIAIPAMPIDPEVLPMPHSTITPDLLASLGYTLPFEMSSVGLDIDFSSDALAHMDLDWETLALAYDLPSQ